MKTFFTSDTHFGHRKMAEYRGFSGTEGMGRELIRRWNCLVPADGTVYHLGDLSFLGWARSREILEQLNGTIKLIPGNHDAAILKHLRKQDLTLKVEVLEPIVKLKLNVGEQIHRIILCHFPLLVWDQAHYGSIHLHGHSHGNLKFPNPTARIMDVGVDAPGSQLAPFSLTEVLAVMRSRDYKPFDQHQEQHGQAKE